MADVMPTIFLDNDILDTKVKQLCSSMRPLFKVSDPGGISKSFYRGAEGTGSFLSLTMLPLWDMMFDPVEVLNLRNEKFRTVPLDTLDFGGDEGGRIYERFVNACGAVYKKDDTGLVRGDDAESEAHDKAAKALKDYIEASILCFKANSDKVLRTAGMEPSVGWAEAQNLILKVQGYIIGAKSNVVTVSFGTARGKMEP